jgi:hypothetical protein
MPKLKHAVDMRVCVMVGHKLQDAHHVLCVAGLNGHVQPKVEGGAFGAQRCMRLQIGFVLLFEAELQCGAHHEVVLNGYICADVLDEHREVRGTVL